MRLFFYGTLCDVEVCARVVGRSAATFTVTEALAPSRRAVYAAGKRYPVLRYAFGAAAPGVVVEDVRARALARLAAFETGYRLARITVTWAGRSGAAWCFLPRRNLRVSHRPFALAPWRGLFKNDYLKRIPRPK